MMVAFFFFKKKQKVESRVSSDEDLKLTELLRYYMLNIEAAKVRASPKQAWWCKCVLWVRNEGRWGFVSIIHVSYITLNKEVN